MLTIISNTKNPNTFAPWEITKDSITKGQISLPYKDLELPIGDCNQSTDGSIGMITDKKLFLDFDRVNLLPSLTASTSDKSYVMALVTEALAEGEKVVYVRSEKGYLLEWNYNVLAGHFDAIVAFRASHNETSVSIFIANGKGEVRELKLFRGVDKSSVSIKRDGFKVRPEIRTDKKLSILPYRPYKPTKHIIAHRSQIAKAKQALGENNGYVFHEYLNLKTARSLLAAIKQDGVKAITIFYNEDALLNLTDDQKFFVRAIAEYFEFVNVSYKGISISRYHFIGKSTVPNRKKPVGAKKSFSKKPSSKDSTQGNGAKHVAGKKPRRDLSDASKKIVNSSYYGAKGKTAPPRKGRK